MRFIPKTIPRFTAGHLTEGLEFLPLIRRQAVLFGLDMDIVECDSVIAMTHERLKLIELTPLAQSLAEIQPRHIRIPYVFWETQSSGLQAPLVGLADDVRGAFGGMEWGDLLTAYRSMAWVNPELEAARFMEAARAQGLLLPATGA